MSKAEEFAKKAWADYEYRESPQGLYSTCFIDGYKAGYEKAEKDLALTWEDIKFITDELVFVGLQSNLIPKSEMLYKEVLRRFNKKKNK